MNSYAYYVKSNLTMSLLISIILLKEDSYTIVYRLYPIVNGSYIVIYEPCMTLHLNAFILGL